MAAFFKRLWPASELEAFGIVLATVSICSLLLVALGYGFGPAITLILSSYDDFTGALKRLAEPYLENLLAYVNAHLNFDLQLRPHWQHIVVPIWLYVSREASNNFDHGRPIVGVVGYLISVPIALVGAFGSETLFRDYPELTLIFPILAFVIYWGIQGFVTALLHHPEGTSIAQSFVYYLTNNVFAHAAVGLVALLAFYAARLWLPDFSPEATTIVILFFYVAALALYWLARGRILARRGREGSTTMGFLMVRVLMLVLVVLVTNAGLQPLGL